MGIMAQDAVSCARLGRALDAMMASGDYAYADIFDLQMVRGRFFFRDFPADRTESIIVNESASCRYLTSAVVYVRSTHACHSGNRTNVGNAAN